MTSFSSAAYWESRYQAGGTSGAGSAGTLGAYKAAVINGFIEANAIRSMIDVGCGDASLLGLLTPPRDYVGVDVSSSALARCAARHPGGRFVTPSGLADVPPPELTVSLDVIYHLVEDAAYISTMRNLFDWATRFVVIYASNVNASWPSPHVRHRRFTDDVERTEPAWCLVAHLPNPRPFNPAAPDETSFSDFFIYGKRGEPCTIRVPEAGLRPEPRQEALPPGPPSRASSARAGSGRGPLKSIHWGESGEGVSGPRRGPVTPSPHSPQVTGSKG